MKMLYASPHDPAGPVRLARRRIAEVMSKPAVTIPLHATLDEALNKMVRTGLRHLAVVDDGGHCTGVLSDRAIAAAWAANYAALAHSTVASVLEPIPHWSVTAITSLTPPASWAPVASTPSRWSMTTGALWV